MTSQPSHAHNNGHLTHPKYRPDIDGLRAIAILPVVGFHAFPNWVKGGFIGVDIFFVISGFLISTIIIGNLERNSFSLVEFYSRRIRRIFPALLLVLIASFAFGWFTLLADEYKHLGKHIAGGAGFVSNFVLWNESGYFDKSSETKPMLHLWSLGIEEQFYIVWPLLLWFAWKQRLNLLTITIAVAAISFALNIGKIDKDAIAVFYSPQTRFWELLAGSVLAYITLHNTFAKFKHNLDMWLSAIVYAQAPEANGNTLRNIQSLVGVVLIAAGFLVITKEQAFQGWWAVLPTAGAVLIISAGVQAWLNRAILSNHVLVWFGLISFPLYLWHWPLLSFARIIESRTPAYEVRIAAVLISIVLAWLTYRLIEKPIRFGKHNKEKTITLLGLMVIVGYTGYNCYKQEGLVFRASLQSQVINDGDIGSEIFFNYLTQNYYLCTPIAIQKEALITNLEASSITRCYQSRENEPIKIAIIGDSHAEALFIGLADALPRTNIVYYTKASLPYINNNDYKNIYYSVLNNNNITTVILTGYWNSNWNPTEDGGNDLIKTVNTLTAAHKMVYITDDVPDFSFDPQGCKYLRNFSLHNNLCKEDINFFYLRHKIFYPILQLIEKANPDVKILKTSEYFCGEGFCNMAKDGILFYRDNDHLNINGSMYLGKEIVKNHPQLVN